MTQDAADNSKYFSPTEDLPSFYYAFFIDQLLS